MTTEDRITTLENASANLEQAIEDIKDALRGTSHMSHAEAYIIPHLEGWLDSRRFNMGIQQYVEALQNEDKFIVEVEFTNNETEFYVFDDKARAETFAADAEAEAYVEEAYVAPAESDWDMDSFSDPSTFDHHLSLVARS